MSDESYYIWNPYIGVHVNCIIISERFILFNYSHEYAVDNIDIHYFNYFILTIPCSGSSRRGDIRKSWNAEESSRRHLRVLLSRKS